MIPGNHDIEVYIGGNFEMHYAITTGDGRKADLRGSKIAAKIKDRLSIHTIADFDVEFTNAERGEFKLCMDYNKTNDIKAREGVYDIMLVWPNDGGTEYREYLLQGRVFFDGGVSKDEDRVEYAATDYLPSWDFSST